MEVLVIAAKDVFLFRGEPGGAAVHPLSVALLGNHVLSKLIAFSFVRHWTGP
jgi:hypothetical protein